MPPKNTNCETVPLSALLQLAERINEMRIEALESAAGDLRQGPHDNFNSTADGWRAVERSLEQLHRVVCQTIETARAIKS